MSQKTENLPGGSVPDGFDLSASRGAFTTHNGPTYRASASDDWRSGLLVLERHCNSMGFLHGGMASAFADGALAWAVWRETRRMSVTLKLSLNFLSIVRAGEWLEARPCIDAVNGELVHVHADLVTREGKAARAEAVFRLLRRKPDR
jgi:acyl-coenzyme A thioesterase PaaI-like protein